MRKLKLLSAAAAAALAAGCAVSPVANDSLERARAAYSAAQQNPQVARLAPAELDLAGRTLNQAERLVREGADSDQVQHVAYVAAQRANTARELGLARAAEAQLADASEARNRVLLEARAREAELARQRAEQAKSQAEQARTEAEQAREQALRAQREREDAKQREAQLSSELRRFESELRDLRAQATDRGWVLSLGSEMLFDVGKSTLKAGGRASVTRIAQLLQKHPERNVLVEGFTDSTGTEELNQRLSEERALAVKQALVEAGVSPNRIVSRGYGEALPVATNDTAAGRQLNRRVQIVLSPSAAATASAGAGGSSSGAGGSASSAR